MKHQRTITVGSGIFGLVAGVGIVSGVLGFGPFKSIPVAVLTTLPPLAIAHLLTDFQSTTQQRQLEERIRRLTKQNETLSTTKTQLEAVEGRNKQLAAESKKTRQALQLATGEQEKTSSLVGELQNAIATLETKITTFESERQNYLVQIEELEAEVQEWEQQFPARVQVEAEERFQIARKNELQKIFDEHYAVTQETMNLFKQLQSWGQKVADRHAVKKQIITDLAANYNSNLGEVSSAITGERDRYLTQIELLNERIGMLQHELAGDLLEPEYGEFGFDPNGKIANAIANWLWMHRKIPLKGTGFEIKPDGTLTAGYSYSRSTVPEALIKAIEEDSPTLTRNLGLYALEGVKKLAIADCLAVTVRRERPTRKADKGSLYRSKEEFIKFILSQPLRLRVIGESGSGKTPSIAVLLSHLLARGFLDGNTPSGRKLPHTVVESCNPLAGVSVKNGDELDFCLKWSDPKKAFKGLAQEYKFRKDPTNAHYKNSVGYIWVADEIDNSMAELTKDEAKPFKDCLKDGGHINMGVIVMGQSANVSTSKGLSIDDQKLMSNVYIDPVSIRTFLTQYGERFYSKRAVEKALATLEEIELEIEEQNEVICDTAREFRIAMVTASRSPVFYQLPYFDAVDIDLQTYAETLETVRDIREGHPETVASHRVPPISQKLELEGVSGGTDKNGHFPMSVSGTRPDTSLKPVCPYCKSDQVRSKGDKWQCLNPEHSSIASDKPKSWRKG